MITQQHNAKPPKISVWLDGVVRISGNAIAWLNVVLVCVIIVQVILRYVFGRGLVYLEELEWHIFGVLIMFGYGYCLTENAHIRLDVFHRKFNKKHKEIIELLGNIFLLLPLLVVLLVHGFDFVQSAYRVGESSDSPLGLPYRWIIKAVIPLSMGFLGVALLSRLIRSLTILFKRS